MHQKRRRRRERRPSCRPSAGPASFPPLASSRSALTCVPSARRLTHRMRKRRSVPGAPAEDDLPAPTPNRRAASLRAHAALARCSAYIVRLTRASHCSEQCARRARVAARPALGRLRLRVPAAWLARGRAAGLLARQACCTRVLWLPGAGAAAFQTMERRDDARQALLRRLRVARRLAALRELLHMARTRQCAAQRSARA